MGLWRQGWDRTIAFGSLEGLFDKVAFFTLQTIATHSFASCRPSKWKKIVSSFGKDTMKFGLFVGSLIGSYKMVLCLMRWIRGKEDRVRELLFSLSISLYLCS